MSVNPDYVQALRKNIEEWKKNKMWATPMVIDVALFKNAIDSGRETGIEFDEMPKEALEQYDLVEAFRTVFDHMVWRKGMHTTVELRSNESSGWQADIGESGWLYIFTIAGRTLLTITDRSTRSENSITFITIDSKEIGKVGLQSICGRVDKVFPIVLELIHQWPNVTLKKCDTVGVG
jgi:hypothetical protein